MPIGYRAVRIFDGISEEAIEGAALIVEDGADAVRREEMKAGAACIKLMASGGVYGHAEELGSSRLTPEEMRAGVEVARGHRVLP